MGVALALEFGVERGWGGVGVREDLISVRGRVGLGLLGFWGGAHIEGWRLEGLWPGFGSGGWDKAAWLLVDWNGIGLTSCGDGVGVA